MNPLNSNEINNIIKQQGLNLLVVSYGGSMSNTLVNVLEKNNYTCKTKIWHNILCHCPHYIDIDIPIIYVYDNPIKSFLSMKKRGHGYWDINQKKLSNSNNIKLSDENLIKLMLDQFNSWTHIKRPNVLIIKSSELFEKTIVDKLETFLQKKIFHFPISYSEPKTTHVDIENFKSNNLFKKYSLAINKVNVFKIVGI